MSNFILDCINGDALMEDIDNYIARWHDSNVEIDLPSFLGMTKREYALFVEDENCLGLIISAYKSNTPIESILRDEMASVTRSDDPVKARRLLHWLESEGLWD